MLIPSTIYLSERSVFQFRGSICILERHEILVDLLGGTNYALLTSASRKECK